MNSCCNPNVTYGMAFITQHVLFTWTEHEACIMDLNELSWHCNYGGRNLQRVQNKTSAAELLNKRLKDDIEFVKKHM